MSSNLIRPKGFEIQEPESKDSKNKIKLAIKNAHMQFARRYDRTIACAVYKIVDNQRQPFKASSWMTCSLRQRTEFHGMSEYNEWYQGILVKPTQKEKKFSREDLEQGGDDDQALTQHGQVLVTVFEKRDGDGIRVYLRPLDDDGKPLEQALRKACDGSGNQDEDCYEILHHENEDGYWDAEPVPEQ